MSPSDIQHLSLEGNERAFDSGYQMTADIANELQSKGDVRFSTTPDANKEITQKSLSKYVSGSVLQNLELGDTPHILGRYGFLPRDFKMTPSAANKLLNGKPEADQPTRAPLSEAEIVEAVGNIHHPALIFKDPYAGKRHPDGYEVPEGAIVMVLNQKDSAGLPLFASIHPDSTKNENVVAFNNLASVFGRDKLVNWVNLNIVRKNLLYPANDTKARDVLQNVLSMDAKKPEAHPMDTGGGQAPLPAIGATGNDNVSKSKEFVKPSAGMKESSDLSGQADKPNYTFNQLREVAKNKFGIEFTKLDAAQKDEARKLAQARYAPSASDMVRKSIAPFAGTTPAQQAALKRVGLITEPEPIRDRLDRLREGPIWISWDFQGLLKLD